LKAFDYVVAHSIEQVVSFLSQCGEDVRLLSGGTDLIIQLREGREQVKLLVDIKAVPELNLLSYDPSQGLLIGAAVSCWRICNDQAVKKYYSGLIDAVELIGSIQIQNRASLGGNLCNASPAADSIPALIVNSAVCIIAGLSGYREVAVESFCTGPNQTALHSDEFLVAVRVPPPPANSGASYLRFTPRNEMDIAVAGAGAAVTLSADGSTFDSARIALSGVAPTPLFVTEAGEALKGQPVVSMAIEQAAQIARQVARPISDMRGSQTQRRHLCTVLTRRALERAIQRANTRPARE
jgi:carbon-monoxide dehydrogenase medium subunit